MGSFTHTVQNELAAQTKPKRTSTRLKPLHPSSTVRTPPTTHCVKHTIARHTLRDDRPISHAGRNNTNNSPGWTHQPPTASDHARALVRTDLLRRTESVKAASLHRLDARERIQFVEWLAQSFSSGDMALIQCRFDSLERWETLLQEVA